jgi:hypothetical protein
MSGWCADNMESDQTTKPASPHLGVGLTAIVVAGGYVGVVLVFGWDAIPCLFGVLMLCSLFFGGIAVLAGLALKANRQRPHRVYIEPLFEGGREGVRLPYGSGFFHWQIVVGPPGSRPEPTLNDPNSDNFWIRWSDGIYAWQQY